MSTPLQSPHIQIISPHQDDAAFSLALTIADLSEAGARLTIVNCFTISHYAPMAPHIKPTAVSDTRHHEDLRFAEMITGTNIIDLHFCDAPLRLGIATEHLCVGRGDSARTIFDSDMPKLEQSFLRLPAADLTLIPLGLGGHIDHLAARDQALSAFRSKPIAFYQDLPYAARFTDVDSEVAAILAELNISCEPCTKYHDNAGERKSQYIAAYSSQASQKELSAIANYPGAERLWLTESAVLLKHLWVPPVKPSS